MASIGDSLLTGVKQAGANLAAGLTSKIGGLFGLGGLAGGGLGGMVPSISPSSASGTGPQQQGDFMPSMGGGVNWTALTRRNPWLLPVLAVALVGGAIWLFTWWKGSPRK